MYSLKIMVPRVNNKILRKNPRKHSATNSLLMLFFFEACQSVQRSDISFDITLVRKEYNLVNEWRNSVECSFAHGFLM